jgi:hypothetical protein
MSVDMSHCQSRRAHRTFHTLVPAFFDILQFELILWRRPVARTGKPVLGCYLRNQGSVSDAERDGSNMRDASL